MYQNRWMTVTEDRVRRADGSTGIYGVVHQPDFALVVPYENGGLHLVEQYRYPVGRRLWELPQGSWEAAGGDPQALAAAELRQETGLVAERITELGYLYEAYGYCDQGCHVLLAEGLTRQEQELDPEELGLRTDCFPLARVWALVDSGQLRDASSIAALALLRRARPELDLA